MTDRPAEPAPHRKRPLFWEARRQIRHDEAADAVQRFINAFFENPGERPRISIPARPDYDDDLVLMSFILQQQSERARLVAEVARMRAALERIVEAGGYPNPKGRDSPAAAIAREALEVKP